MIERRQVLKMIAALAALPSGGCGAHHAAASHRWPGSHDDFQRVTSLSMPVWRIGPQSGPTLVLLHELPGLDDDDLALARGLSREGFTVYTPLMFGQLGRRNDALGLIEACLPRPGGRRFECSALSKRSNILNMLEPVCDEIAALAGGPVGVIGMCLTGILPLALLPNHVAAAVLCQPTLPFDFIARKPAGRQLTNLGLGDGDLKEAMDSKVPFLAMHYSQDPLSPSARLHAIEQQFGSRAAIIELPGDGKHSSLASDLDADAFADAVSYLKVRLNVDKAPARMKVARLGGRECEISVDGWRVV